MRRKYAIEWNGDCWQSVFPEDEAHKSALHETVENADAYMRFECGVEEYIELIGPEEDE